MIYYDSIKITTIGISEMFNYKYLGGTMINKIKKHNLKLIIGTSIVVVIGAGIFYANTTSGKENIKIKISEIYYSQFEAEEYKNQFEETVYKNYKILHNEEAKVILPLLFTYLDEMELKASELFSYIPKSELTIQLDFNKDVFKNRLSIGDSQRDSAGYYNKTLDKIYMNVEAVFREIIRDMHKVEKLDDGSFIMQPMSFKEKLFNLYYNNVIENFLKDNNLSEDIFPIWFINGLKEYYCSMAVPIYETSIFLPLKELDDSNVWSEASEGEENSKLFAQSTYLIHKIIQISSESAINEIIEKCKTKTFNESFNDVMEISLDEFENEVSKSYNIYDSEYYAITRSDLNKNIDVKIQCLEEYIKYNDDDIRAYEFLSSLYDINSGFEKAVDFLKDSIEKYPKEDGLWWQLALIYENNNMPDLAKECYDKNAKLKNE